MAKTVREILRDEMTGMTSTEARRFRAELRKRLPSTVAQAAQAAKKGAKTVQVKNTVAIGDKNR